MTQHVHTGIGGDGRRDRGHQRRVKNGDIRQQRRIHQYQFSAWAFTTEKAVTSEPVPLVVGIATKAGRFAVSVGRVCAKGQKITALAASITEPPPSADNQIRIAGIHPLHTAHHGGDIRIATTSSRHEKRCRAHGSGASDAIGEAKFNHRLVGHQQDVAGGSSSEPQARPDQSGSGFQQKFTHWVIHSLSVPETRSRQWRPPTWLCSARR